jgi:hypothetical protein
MCADFSRKSQCLSDEGISVLVGGEHRLFNITLDKEVDESRADHQR